MLSIGTGSTFICPNGELFPALQSALQKEAAARGEDAHKLCERLTALANDTNVSAESRRDAILALGLLATPKSLEFLVENITLVLPYELRGTEHERLLWTPCYYALIKDPTGSQSRWSRCEAVFAALQKKRSRAELLKLASVLVAGFGPPGAIKHVQAELELERTRQVPDQIRLHNLTVLSDILTSTPLKWTPKTGPP
jgi:hypothetical protein